MYLCLHIFPIRASTAGNTEASNTALERTAARVRSPPPLTASVDMTSTVKRYVALPDRGSWSCRCALVGCLRESDSSHRKRRSL